MRQVVLDTETTGLDPKQGHRLIEIGCLELQDRKITGRNFQTYLNPEREVDEGAYRVTGLDLAFLSDKPKFLAQREAFLDYIQGAELIIHNAPFDLGFIKAELSASNSSYDINQHSILDTLLMAKRLFPGQRNSLDALCRRYNIDRSHRSLHGALLDAELLARVYLQMTAGQTTFQLGQEPVTDKTDTNRYASEVLESQFKVYQCLEPELAQHEARLKEIEHTSQGHCLWLR